MARDHSLSAAYHPSAHALPTPLRARDVDAPAERRSGGGDGSGARALGAANVAGLLQQSCIRGGFTHSARRGADSLLGYTEVSLC
jgi:hypothetical protein